MAGERSGLADALEAAHKELKGFKENSLDSERAKQAALESRSRAQVTPTQASQLERCQTH